MPDYVHVKPSLSMAFDLTKWNAPSEIEKRNCMTYALNAFEYAMNVDFEDKPILDIETANLGGVRQVDAMRLQNISNKMHDLKNVSEAINELFRKAKLNLLGLSSFDIDLGEVEDLKFDVRIIRETIKGFVDIAPKAYNVMQVPKAGLWVDVRPR
jgi:hypothetical protein